MFLQSAGTDFNTAHDLVAAVSEIIRAPHNEQALGDASVVRHHIASTNHGVASRRPALDPARLAERIEQAGFDRPESLLVTLAVLMTTASPHHEVHVDWVSSAAAHIGDTDLLLETAGVLFAFNTINRIADARRVQLEYRFLRELKPIRGWVERRLVSVTSLAYDLSFKHRPRQSSTELQDRIGTLFKRLGGPAVPDVFDWLSRSPVVLEGVLEMIEANVAGADVRVDLLREAVAIGVASRSMPDSGLRRAFGHWLPQESLADSQTLRAWAAPSGATCNSDLVAACRRYSWQVANAAYTVTDEQIRVLFRLGLTDAELLDLTLATAVFSSLAIIEPMSAAIAPALVPAEQSLPSTEIGEVQVQLA